MSAEEVVNSLSQAREMAFSNPALLPSILPSVCQIAETHQFLAVQQWVSQFFCDVISPESAEFPFAAKQDACAVIIPTLLKLTAVQDVMVYRNVVLTAASMYELVFDLVAKVSNQHLWSQMTELKHVILSKWETPYPLTPRNDDLDKFRSIGCKVAAVKFIGRVITVQSGPVVATDPRRRGAAANDPNDICIANLSENHTVLSRQHLEAEARGLFDMLVTVFQREEFLISELYIAVLENLVYIIQKRKQMSQPVFEAISAIDLDSKYQHASHKLLRYKMGRRFVERAIKNCLNYCLRAQLVPSHLPQNTTFANMVATIDSKMNEQKRRGILTVLPWDNPRKKMKVDPTNPFPRDILTVDDKSLTSLFQLIDDNDPLVNFDVTQIPTQTLANICTAAISKTDSTKLITALSIVSARYTDLMSKLAGSNNASAPPPAVKAEAKEEQILKNDDEDNREILQEEQSAEDTNIDSTFVLSAPQKLSEEDKKKHLELIIKNFFTLAKIPAGDKSISSFNMNDTTDSATKISQVAINDWGKNSWLVLLTRLATRGLQPGDDATEHADQIREAIFQYFLENVRDRIEIVIEWLNEEWYAEFTRNAKNKSKKDTTPVQTPNYNNWCSRALDSMIPFLESTDRKLFIRLLSELPYLNVDLVEKIKSLCIDPLRADLGMQSLQFLLMFRPPVKDACVSILKELYENNEELKAKALQLLKKYSPEEVPVEEPAAVSVGAMYN